MRNNHSFICAGVSL